jgi:hypothetical protein
LIQRYPKMKCPVSSLPHFAASWPLGRCDVGEQFHGPGGAGVVALKIPWAVNIERLWLLDLTAHRFNIC